MKTSKPILLGTAMVPPVALLAFMLWHLAKPAGHVAVPHSPAPPDSVAKRLALIAEMAKSDPNYRWKIPLEFYGKVVDQHGETVPNAKAEIHYTPDPNGEKWYELTTAADGTFTYGGVKGQYLYVKVGAPEGYGVVDSTCSADYNYAVPGEFNFHVPDPDRPVVFKVWKYVNPEPMHNWRLERDLSANDGTVYWFDMRDGEIGGNDLGASILDRSFVKSPTDWCGLKITAGPGCGVIEDKGVAMMYAPEKGYKREIRHSFTGKPGEFIDDGGDLVRGSPFVFHLYFRGSDATYAAVDADISPAHTYRPPEGKSEHYDGSVLLSIKKNPSGSRSLEYVESLSIQDGKSGH